MILQDNHSFIGMRTDNSPVNQDPRFLRDAFNIRFTDSNNGSYLSLTNEKGSARLSIYEDYENFGNTIYGKYIGHCIVGDYLVLFTHSDDYEEKKETVQYKDHIYAIYKSGEYYILKHIYESNNLNFSVSNPLQTLGVIEGDNVYKVYWTDGVNPPRVINILQKELKIQTGVITEDEIKAKLDKTRSDLYVLIYGSDNKSDIFDFVPELELKENVSITKNTTGGMFSSGTIQYAFTYYNKYGKESNIFYTTGLYYISYDNRGGSEKDVIPNSFTIKITDFEHIYDYIRIYSIHRTSQDAVPTVKIVTDIEVPNTKDITELSYTDTGTTGDAIDPTKLLYIGGEDIVVGTISAKDNTLFMGNISINRPAIPIDTEKLLESENVDYTESSNTILLSDIDAASFYPYSSQLMGENPATFMPGETYRFGIQFQYKNGKWSNPIFYADKQIPESAIPSIDYSNKTLLEYFPVLKIKDQDVLNTIWEAGYRKIRGVIVQSSIQDMSVLAHGIVNPTVFSSYNREKNSPFAQSSWFFRPINKKNIEYTSPNNSTNTNNIDITNGAVIPFRHLEPLLGNGDRGCEIQNNMYLDLDTTTNYLTAKDNAKKDVNVFYVDQNIVTFHSPDIEFNDSIRQFIDRNKVNFEITGLTAFKNSAGDISIQTSTPAITSMDTGEKSFRTYTSDYSNRILCAGLFYNSHAADDANNTITTYKWDESEYCFNWMVYPWHRNGALNNDSTRSNGVKSSELKKKIVANIRVSVDNIWLSSDNYWSPINNITKVDIFNSDEIALNKIDAPVNSNLDVINYYGNIDTLNLYKAISQNNNVPAGYNFYVGQMVGQKGTIFNVDSSEKPKPIVTSEIAANIYPISSLRDIGDKMLTLKQVHDAVRMKYKSSIHGIFAFNYTQDGHQPVILPYIKLDNTNNNYNAQATVKVTPFWEKNIYSTNVSTQSGGPSTIEKTSINVIFINYAYDIITETGGKDIKDIILEEFNDFTLIYTYKEGDLAITTSPNYIGNTGYASIYKYTGGKWIILEPASNTVYTTTENTIYPGMSSGEVSYPYTKGMWQLYTEDTKYKTTLISYKQSGGDDPENPNPPIISSLYTPYQDYITISNNILKNKNSFLFMGRLTRTGIINRFGGNTKEALRNNLWIPAGNAVSINRTINKENRPEYELCEVEFKHGDTYYMRYDCLKTQPFTEEDQNSIVDIASFMCLTRVNLDGRYDKNRGLISNLNIRKTNFNLINDIYNQKDNYFNYRILDNYYYGISKYPNQFIWSLQKSNLEDVDTWTNITLANSYDIYNNCGTINSIELFNDNLYLFQDRGFSQIMFNNRVQIPVSDGVPVEISNNSKVEGIKDISTQIGCTDKRHITQSATTLYFVDSNTDRFYGFNQQLKDLGTTLFNNKWFIEHHPNSKWDIDNSNYSLCYDRIMNDVYATSNNESLCYSENLGQFTSKMFYNHILDNYLDNFITILPSIDNECDVTAIWLNRGGNYNTNYDKTISDKQVYLSYICNDNPQLSKVFDTIEFNTDIYDRHLDDYVINPLKTFEFIEAKDSYQETQERLLDTNRGAMTPSLRKKFNIWRCIIPRQYGTRNRLRDTWAEIKLGFYMDGNTDFRFVLNSLQTKYSV